VFNAQEEQILRRLVDLLRHLNANRRSLVVSEALQRVTLEDGSPTVPARDAETLQVSRRIAPPPASDVTVTSDPRADDDE
jgi:hypothetical protein